MSAACGSQKPERCPGAWTAPSIRAYMPAVDHHSANASARTHGSAITASLIITAVLALLTGLSLLLDWSYLTSPGFRTVPGEYGPNPVSGMKIWDIGKFLMTLLAAAWFTTLILFAYQRILRRPSLVGAAVLGLLVALACALFAPVQDTLQVRIYNGPAQTTVILFGSPTWPLFDHTTKSRNVPYGGDHLHPVATYRCIEERVWKIAGVVIEKSFYPILDDQHMQQLLQQRCTRIAGAPPPTG